MSNSLMTNRSDTQAIIFREIEYSLSSYIKELIDTDSWCSLIMSINEVFQKLIVDQKILKIKEICNNFCSDYILEYDISFSEGWFLYCHLRNSHLMLKFVPKEF